MADPVEKLKEIESIQKGCKSRGVGYDQKVHSLIQQAIPLVEQMQAKKCETCYGISCPHWSQCFPELRSDIKELETKTIDLQSTIDSLVGALEKYGKAWITPKPRSMYQLKTDMDEAYETGNEALAAAKGKE